MSKSFIGVLCLIGDPCINTNLALLANCIESGGAGGHKAGDRRQR
jgi:hypothetical protein